MIRKNSKDFFLRLISDANIQECFEHLEELISKEIPSKFDEITAIKSIWSKNEEQKRINIISNEKYKRNLANTVKSLLDFINTIPFKEINGILRFSSREHGIFLREIDFIRTLFKDLPDLLGSPDYQDLSGNIIKSISNGLSFGRQVNFYITGRTGAGKSTSCNNFLNVNITGNFDTTNGVTHSGFGTGLSLFDLPGQGGNPRLENVNRVTLGLGMLSIDQEDSYSDDGEFDPFIYNRFSPESDKPQESKIYLNHWEKFSKENKLEPHLILYVIGIGSGPGFLRSDEQYLGDLLIRLKKDNSLNDIIFLLNEREIVDKPEVERVKQSIGRVYLSKIKEISKPSFFSINAKSGNGFDEVLKYICLTLSPEAVGQIKDLFKEDYQEEIKKKLSLRFINIAVNIASRISKLMPFEKMFSEKDINFIFALKSIVYLASELLCEKRHEKEIIKSIKEIETSIKTLTDEFLIKTIEPQTIKIKVAGERETNVLVTVDFDTKGKRKFLEEIDYEDAKKHLKLKPIKSTTTLKYPAVVGVEDKIFSGLNDSYLDYTEGTFLIPYNDLEDDKVSGKWKAFQNRDLDFLDEEYDQITRNCTVHDAIIGERVVNVTPKFKKNGLPIIELILGLSLDLLDLFSSDPKSIGQHKTENLRKRIKFVSEKLKPVSAQINSLVQSNDPHSYNELAFILESTFTGSHTTKASLPTAR
jgi:hypothetical protein